MFKDMKKFVIGLVAGIATALALSASAQLMYGNSFPFWDVRGPLTTQTLAVSGNSTLTGNLTVGGTQTTTGVQTFTAAPVMTALTASLPVFTNGSKALASNAMTGTGSVVMSASPTLTGTIGAANQTLSGTLGVTGVSTFTAAPIFSSTTASTALFVDGTKNLVSNAITGTGNVVMSSSPTLVTPTLGAALATSINGNTITTGTGVLTIAAAKTLTASNTLTLTGTDTSSVAFGTGGTVAYIASPTFTGVTTTPELVVSTSATPLAADACTAGKIVWGADYIYVCTASGAWKRAALTGGY